MTNWRSTKLRDEIELAYGKSLPSQDREPGSFNVFGSNGIVGVHSEALVQGPGIIVGRKGSVGELVFSDRPFWPIDTTYFVVNRKGHDWRFLYHLLRAQGLSELNSHSAVPGLNREDVYSIDVAFPNLDEQTLIGAVIDTVEDSIGLEEQALSEAASLKLTAMRELFTRGLRGEAQKETEIGLIPESWVLTPAEQIFKLTSGKTRPDNLVPEATPEKPFPVLGGNGTMGYSSEWNFESEKTLVIGRVGEYCGAVHVASGKFWITDNALYAKDWLNPSVNIGYVAAFLHYFDLNRFKRMAGQPLVTQGMINEHSFPVPSPDEQREIVDILEAIDRKIDLHKRKRALFAELFKALLHKLMTGQISVTDLDLTALGTSPVEVVAA
jgi:type I restriction enzyme S subunit